MLAAQGGANLIYGAGMLELGITFDLAQFVIDNEIFKMIKKAIEGINVTDVDMAIDIIKEVGPGGEFIGHRHTFDNFRKLQSYSKLIDRSMRDAWLMAGAKDLTERAYEEVEYILANHKPEPLANNVIEELRSIVENAEKEYAAKKK